MRMFTTIIVTMIITSVNGLLECEQYCRLPKQNLGLRPDCNCLTITPTQPLKDNGIYYEPISLEPNIHRLPKQLFSMENPISSTLSKNISNLTLQKLQSRKRFADKSRHHPIESLHKHIRRDHTSQVPTEDPTSIRVPEFIYVDIDVDISRNVDETKLKEIEIMFRELHTIERHMKSCMDHHIYIFPKSSDNNQTTVKNNLTEIHNHCNKLDSVIKKSVYEITQKLTPKSNVQDFPNEKRNINKKTAPNSIKSDTQSDTTESLSNENSDVYDVYKLTSESTTSSESVEEGNETSLGPYETLSTSEPNIELTPNLDKVGTLNIDTVQSETKFNHNKDPSKSTLELPQTHPAVEEKDIIIPMVMTKESTTALISVVKGHEKLPNSDFIKDQAATASSNTVPTLKAPTPVTNLDQAITETTTVQTNLIEFEGKLYFNFGKILVPARFLQHSDGEMYVAIDGISLCDQTMRQKTNVTTLLSMLCKHIQNNNK